jgi:WD40 repeat protein
MFTSFSGLRAAHLELLKRHADTEAVLPQIETFIAEASVTGAVLDAEDDRGDAQTIIDYWTSVAYRTHGTTGRYVTLAAFDPALAPTLDESVRPYVGLEPFREDTQELFRGRKQLVDETLERLRSLQFLAAIGASGSGKSSLVLAGVIPALKAGAIENSERWHYYDAFVPNSEPLVSLARAVRPPDADVEWVQQHASELARKPDHLRDLVRASSAESAVIVVDQFEEIFTLCSDPAKRQAFADNLVGLLAAGARHRVIITMRRDFEERLVLLPTLEPFLRQGRVYVTALSASELREAIETPAERAGLRFEKGIVDRIVGDILGESAGLPLLQFTLLKLWDGRQHNLVTWEAFKRLGGCRQALARSADAFYDALQSNQDRHAAKLILLRLVRPVAGFEFTSNRVPLSALHSLLNDRQRVDQVLAKLLEARLVRIAPGATAADTQVEVAHEALIRNWPMLIDWLGEAQENLRRRARLTDAARQWDALGRDPGALWSTVQLTDIRETEIADGLDDLERAFLAATRRAIGAAEREKAEMVEQKRRATAWRTRFLIVTAVAGVLAVIALGLTVRTLVKEKKELEVANDKAELALKERDHKATELTKIVRQLEDKTSQLVVKNGMVETQKDELQRKNSEIALLQKRAELGQLAAKAQLLSTQQRHLLQTSVLLGIEARKRVELVEKGINRQDTAPVADMIRTALTKLPMRVGSMEHKGRVTNAFFDAEGQFMATLERTEDDETERVRVWAPDSLTGKWNQLLDWQQPGVRSVLFSARGKYLVATGRKVGSSVVIWDLRNKKQMPSPPIEGSILTAEFSADGDKLLLAERDAVRWWEVSERQFVRSSPHEGAVACQIAPGGEWIAVMKRGGGEFHPVELRHTGGAATMRVLDHSTAVSSMTFNSDGRYLVTTTRDGVTRVWRTADGKEVSRLADADFAMLAFMPKSDHIATATRDGAIKVWEAATGRVVARMRHEGRIQTLVFSGTGDYLATSGDDFTARVWEAMTGREIARVGHDNSVTAAVFSPDAQFLVTTGLDRNAHVWKMPIDPHGQRVGTGEVLRLAFDQSGRQLLKTWRSDSPSALDFATSTSKTVPAANVQSALWSPNGTHVVTVGRDREALLWDVSSGAAVALKAKVGNASAMSFSRDGSRLAVAGANGVEVFDPAGKVVVTLPGETGARRVALSHDARYVAVGENRRVRLIAIDKSSNDRPLSRKVSTLLFEDGIKLMAFDHHGKYLAGADNYGEVRLLEIETGREIGPLVHSADVLNLLFSTDGKRLATWADDRTARVWDIVTRRQIAKLSHDASVSDVAFTNNDRDLVTLSRDGIARRWDLASATETGRMRLGTGIIIGVLGPDAKYLATAIRSGTKPADIAIYVRTFDPQDLLTEACRRLTRNLTYHEWIEYFPGEEYRKTCDNLPVHQSLVAAGKDLARNGDAEGAAKLLRRVVQLDPQSRKDIDPDKDPWRLGVPGQLKKKLALARRGQIKQAAAAYLHAQSLDPNIQIDENWTRLCWYGGLWERPKDVLFACEKSVQQLNDIESHIARGLVLSVLGEPKRGAADFQRAIDIGRKDGRAPAPDVVEFLKEMSGGSNPFTTRFLEQFRDQ